MKNQPRFDQLCAVLLRVLWEKDEAHRKENFVRETGSEEGYKESESFSVMIPLRYLVDVEQGKGSSFAFGFVTTGEPESFDNTYMRLTRHKNMDDEKPSIILPRGRIQ